MAGVVERYNQRVDSQAELDRLFPNGAFYTLVRERADGSMLPQGVEGTTGRVFCSDADTDEDGWWFELMFDWATPETERIGFEVRPWTARVRDLSETGIDGLYEGAVLGEDGSAVRVAADPQGPRAPVAGQRDLVTERRLGDLFSRGLEHITMEAVQ